MKDFWHVVKHRRSARAFLKKTVPEQYIQIILKSAYLAPSGSNQKNWEFIVLKDNSKKHELKSIVFKKINEITALMSSERARKEFKNYSKYFTFFSDAPVVIITVIKPYDSLTARILKRYCAEERYESFAGIQSVSAAIENMLLAATALGLAACWMTGPLIAKKDLETILNIQYPSEIAALIPLGFPKYKLRPNEFPESTDKFVKYM